MDNVKRKKRTSRTPKKKKNLRRLTPSRKRKTLKKLSYKPVKSRRKKIARTSLKKSSGVKRQKKRQGYKRRRVLRRTASLKAKHQFKRRLALFGAGVGFLILTFIPDVARSLRYVENNFLTSGQTTSVIYIDSGNQISELSTSFSQEPVKVDKGLLKTDKKKGSPPSRVVIPSIQVDLTVEQSKIVRGYWEVFADKAGFGEGSSYPGEAGNQVIFAHARNKLFGDLPKVNIDDSVYILTDEGWYKYQVVEKKEVTPDQTEVIAATEDETLTLYTCSGFADSKRLIVVAKRAH